MSTRLLLGDCREMLKALDADSIDACVTDPPYGLSFMGKAWDYDVPSADIWREVFRVLKPGDAPLFAGLTEVKNADGPNHPAVHPGDGDHNQPGEASEPSTA